MLWEVLKVNKKFDLKILQTKLIPKTDVSTRLQMYQPRSYNTSNNYLLYVVVVTTNLGCNHAVAFSSFQCIPKLENCFNLL